MSTGPPSRSAASTQPSARRWHRHSNLDLTPGRAGVQANAWRPRSFAALPNALGRLRGLATDGATSATADQPSPMSISMAAAASMALGACDTGQRNPIAASRSASSNIACSQRRSLRRAPEQRGAVIRRRASSTVVQQHAARQQSRRHRRAGLGAAAPPRRRRPGCARRTAAR